LGTEKRRIGCSKKETPANPRQGRCISIMVGLAKSVGAMLSGAAKGEEKALREGVRVSSAQKYAAVALKTIYFRTNLSPQSPSNMECITASPRAMLHNIRQCGNVFKPWTALDRRNPRTPRSDEKSIHRIRHERRLAAPSSLLGLHLEPRGIMRSSRRRRTILGHRTRST